jgi:hypothetical protein
MWREKTVNENCRYRSKDALYFADLPRSGLLEQTDEPEPLTP